MNKFWSHPLFFPLLLLVIFMAVLMGQTQHRVARVDTAPGFALDDSWIHASIAKNMIQGQGYGINNGQWIPLSTAPAWTFLLAGAMLVVHNPVTAGLLIGFLCQTGAVLLLYVLAYRLTRHRFWSLVPALLLTLQPVLLWGYASGMELPLVAFAVVLCLYLFDRTSPTGKGRLIGLPLALLLAVLSRPELFVLVPMAILITFGQVFYRTPSDRPTALRAALRVAAMQSALFLVGIAPYFIFNALTTGHLFPTAFHVKAGLRDVGLFAALTDGDWTRVGHLLSVGAYEEWAAYIMTFAKYNLVLTLVALPGLLTFFHPFRERQGQRAALLVALLLLLPLVMGAVSPTASFSNYANRYLAPFVPPLMLLAGLGLWLLWSRMGQRSAALVCLLLILIPVGQRFKPTLVMYARDVKNTNELYVKSGQWIRDNIDPALPIAINDIGGISYFIENDIIDVMGLASPEIWPALDGTYADGKMTTARSAAIQKYLAKRQIPYFVSSPRYYRDLHSQTNLFVPVRTWPAAFPTKRAIDPQILYQIHWPPPPTPAQPEAEHPDQQN